MADLNIEKVLIIDDERHLLVVLSAFIRRAGYEVLSADSGNVGIQLAKEQKPNLILCDVMMPPPNGFEVKKILADDPETCDIPFIFLTARSGSNDKVFGFEAGADDYITKPFNDHELLARIKAALRRSKISQQQVTRDATAKMEELRQEILKNVTSELRLPLVNIMSSLELILLKKYVDPHQQQLFFETAMSSAQFLKGFIDDVIILTNIDDGKLDNFRQPVNLRTDFNEIIHQSMERYQTKALEVFIGVGEGVNLYAPKVEFRRSVAHLVDNACKYSPTRGRVEVNLKANGDGGGILTVTDQGPGIPATLREKVFDRYYQYNPTLGVGYGGLGIGLTIARSVARSMNGDVVVQDTRHGCKVQMVIPPLVDVPPTTSIIF